MHWFVVVVLFKMHCDVSPLFICNNVKRNEQYCNEHLFSCEMASVHIWILFFYFSFAFTLDFHCEIRERKMHKLYLQSSQLRQTLAGLDWRGEKTRLSSGFELRFVCFSYGDIWLLEFCAYCFGCFRAMEVRGMRMCIYLISFIHDGDRKVSAFHFNSLTYIFVETRYIVDLGNFIETKESLWGKQWYAMKKRWFHNICKILINLLKSLNVYFCIAGRLELKMSGIS